MKIMKIDPLFVIPHKNILPDSLIRGKILNYVCILKMLQKVSLK